MYEKTTGISAAINPDPIQKTRMVVAPDQNQEKSRPGATPNGFFCDCRPDTGSAASAFNPDATWLMRD